MLHRPKSAGATVGGLWVGGMRLTMTEFFSEL